VDCERDPFTCDRRVVRLVRVAGTDRWRIADEEGKRMARGVKGSGTQTKPAEPVDAERGRRQIVSLAVRYGLTAEDLAGVAEQVRQMAGLVGRWREVETAVMGELLAARDGRSLVELAAQATEEAWQRVAGEFERAFPGYRAQLVKGRVSVQEA
jgi:hypothetical protein